MKVNIFNTDKKYSVIYADPPWIFKNYSDKGKRRNVEKHYPCMRKEDMQKLPIKEIANDNSALFLWVTFHCLKEGFDLLDKWGFEYKTCAFVWVKKNKKTDGLFWGMGYYTRSNTEICLLATRGKPLERISKSVHQVVLSRIEEHSKKPSEIRDRIVELFGDISKIELFARQEIPNWDSWGNEI